MEKRVEAWTVWPSKNLWYCRGMCLSGPDRKYFYVSLTLLLLPAIFWYAFSVPYLLDEIHFGFLIAHCLVLSLALITLFIAGFMDPGIIPRRHFPPDIDLTAIDPLSYRIRSIRVTSKYCETCNIWRPPRSSHCAICDNWYV